MGLHPRHHAKLCVDFPNIPEHAWNPCYDSIQNHFTQWLKRKTHSPKQKAERRKMLMTIMNDKKGKRKGGSPLEDLTASRKSMEEMISTAGGMTDKQKTEARAQLTTDFETLQQTVKDIKAEAPTSASADALFKLKEVANAIFQKTFAEQFEILSKLTQDKASEEKLQKELIAQTKQSWTGWLWEKSKEAFWSLWSKVVLAIKGIIWFAGKVLGVVKNVAVYLSQKVVENPNQSRMMLVMLKIFKTLICRQLGVYMQANSKERADKNLDVSFAPTFETLSELSGPLLEKGIAAALPAAVQKTGSLVKKGASLAFKFIPIPGIGEGLAALSDMIIDGMTESLGEAVEFYMYYSSVMKGFQQIIDLFDPRSCWYQFTRSQKEVACIMKENPREKCIELTKLTDAEENQRVQCSPLKSKIYESTKELVATQDETARTNIKTRRLTEQAEYLDCLVKTQLAGDEVRRHEDQMVCKKKGLDDRACLDRWGAMKVRDNKRNECDILPNIKIEALKAMAKDRNDLGDADGKRKANEEKDGLEKARKTCMESADYKRMMTQNEQELANWTSGDNVKPNIKIGGSNRYRCTCRHY